MATNAQLLIMIRALQSDVAAIRLRVTTLEGAAPAPNEDLAALEARVTTLEQTTCPNQAEIDALNAAVGILDADHVPEP